MKKLDLTLVPNLGEEKRKILYKSGVILERLRKGYPFVGYTLPSGWALVDNSKKKHFLRYIIDSDMNIRFIISGKWDGMWNFKLEWTFCKEPFNTLNGKN